MGWYGKEIYGNPSRKQLCASLFDDEKDFDVLKASSYGATVYMAVRNNKTGDVFGDVFLTSIEKDMFGRTFMYKEMPEDMGPCRYGCPDSILEMLTPTEDTFANEWRQKCRECNEDRRKLRKLPVGSRIIVKIHGDDTELVKHEPAYQFRAPFWLDEEEDKYVSPSCILDFGFSVVEDVQGQTAYAEGGMTDWNRKSRTTS